MSKRTVNGIEIDSSIGNHLTVEDGWHTITVNYNCNSSESITLHSYQELLDLEYLIQSIKREVESKLKK